MEVTADMHLVQKDNLVALGSITINNCITIKNVRMLSKKNTQTGEETMFISLPGYLSKKEGEKDAWKNIVYAPDKKDREKINAAIVESIKLEVVKDLNLPEVEARVTCLEKGNVKGLATLDIDGIRIVDVKIMNGKNGLFVSMPQYKSKDETGKEVWNDIVYPNNAAMRTKISTQVLEEYQTQLQLLDETRQVGQNKNPNQAWMLASDMYILIEKKQEGYGYQLYPKNLRTVIEHKLEEPVKSMEEAKKLILKKHQIEGFQPVDVSALKKKIETTELTGLPPVFHGLFQKEGPWILDPAGEPVVRIVKSDSLELRDNLSVPLHVAEEILRKLDQEKQEERKGAGYDGPQTDSVEIELDFTMQGKAGTYVEVLQIGSGKGILDGKEEGSINYLENHCKLARNKAEAALGLQRVSGKDEGPEKWQAENYYRGVEKYVEACQKELNQAVGDYHFPNIPNYADFPAEPQKNYSLMGAESPVEKGEDKKTGKEQPFPENTVPKTGKRR